MIARWKTARNSGGAEKFFFLAPGGQEGGTL